MAKRPLPPSWRDQIATFIPREQHRDQAGIVWRFIRLDLWRAKDGVAIRFKGDHWVTAGGQEHTSLLKAIFTAREESCVD